MSDDEKCPNKEDNPFYACYNASIYGPCGEENCGGVCTQIGPCIDETHERESKS